MNSTVQALADFVMKIYKLRKTALTQFVNTCERLTGYGLR